MSDESDPLENGTRGKLLLWDSFYLMHLVFMTGWRQLGGHKRTWRCHGHIPE
jgi:hypothetical protein